MEVHSWDCRSLGLEDGEITKIVTNPPWGIQVGEVDQIAELYLQFIGEAKRVLSASGKIVLLTDQTKAVEDACLKICLRVEPLLRISLHGLVPTVYEIG